MEKHFKKLNEYNDWANRMVLRAMNSANELEPRILTLYNHILAAQKLWLGRIDGSDYSSISAWTEFGLEELDELRQASNADLTSFLDSLGNGDLQKTIQYQDTEGNPYENSLEDILTHLFNHSTYHRAQINQLLRKGGAEPAINDYIMFVRNPVKA
jgi:uncharacterized damage-inducible protein DinB